jgi:hypothetical protein
MADERDPMAENDEIGNRNDEDIAGIAADEDFDELDDEMNEDDDEEGFEE